MIKYTFTCEYRSPNEGVKPKIFTINTEIEDFDKALLFVKSQTKRPYYTYIIDAVEHTLDGEDIFISNSFWVGGIR